MIFEIGVTALAATGVGIGAFALRTAVDTNALLKAIERDLAGQLTTLKRDLKTVEGHLNIDLFDGGYPCLRDVKRSVARLGHFFELEEKLDKLGAKLGVSWIKPQEIKTTGEWSSD